jgi:hypothetical protein
VCESYHRLGIRLNAAARHKSRLFKKVVFISPDRKLHRLSGLGVGSNCLPSHQIEDDSGIVDGVAENKTEFVWDGFIGFSDDGPLCALWVLLNGDRDRSTGKKFPDLAVEVLDMMFGSF